MFQRLDKGSLGTVLIGLGAVGSIVACSEDSNLGALTPADGAVAGDGGTSDTPGENGGRGPGDDPARPPSAGPNGRPDVCADVRVESRRIVPTVTLLVDQSGSMSDNEFGDSGTRWDAIKASLLDPQNGIVAAFQGRMRIGMTLYSARSRKVDGISVPDGPCPVLTRVPPALNAYVPINAALRDTDTIEETPTSDSYEAILPELVADPDPDPKIVILATDGDPDYCENLNPGDRDTRRIARDRVVDVVERAFQMGIRTFVIGVGEGSVSRQHLQDVANAGVGAVSGDENAPFAEAGDEAALRDALGSILDRNTSCQIELRGQVDMGQECTGTVTLGGEELGCNDPNGWRLIDANHIELLGSACERLAATDDELTASFPCGVVLI